MSSQINIFFGSKKNAKKSYFQRNLKCFNGIAKSLSFLGRARRVPFAQSKSLAFANKNSVFQGESGEFPSKKKNKEFCKPCGRQCRPKSDIFSIPLKQSKKIAKITAADRETPFCSQAEVPMLIKIVNHPRAPVTRKKNKEKVKGVDQNGETLCAKWL